MTDRISETFAFACKTVQSWELILDPEPPSLKPGDNKAFEAAREHVLDSTEELLVTCWTAFSKAAQGDARYRDLTRRRPTSAMMQTNQWWYKPLPTKRRTSTYFGVALEESWNGKRIELFAFLEGPADRLKAWDSRRRRHPAGKLWGDINYCYGGVKVEEKASMAALAQELVKQCWSDVADYVDWCAKQRAL